MTNDTSPAKAAARHVRRRSGELPEPGDVGMQKQAVLPKQWKSLEETSGSRLLNGQQYVFNKICSISPLNHC